MQSSNDPVLTISGLSLISFTFSAGWGGFCQGRTFHGGTNGDLLARGHGSGGQGMGGAGSTRGVGCMTGRASYRGIGWMTGRGA